PLNSLGLSACNLLITNIYIAGNISFLLSFGATAGIITLYPYFSSKKGIKILNPKNRLISIKNTVFLSLSVLLFTAPISGFFFGSVSLLSPISSVVCSAPVSAVIITAFISLCTNAPFIYQICGFCCSALYRIIEFLSEFDFCIYPLNMSRIYIYYVILTAVILTVYFISKNNKSGKVILSVLICCTIMLMSEILLNYYSYPNTEIFISACGNATNICISSYNSGYNVLIGTGENYDDYSLMLAHMKTKGIFRFDSLIVPRDSAAESGMIEKYSKFYADNIYDSENFILSLKNNMTYKNISNSSFSAGILSDENIKIVFSFYPGGNFDNADEELLYGDYLVCRGSIPKNLLADNFDKIIVLSDKLPSELDLPENASTTAQTGDISIII
ncbi:MAG: ComEC/Rec2 family competence protein, partial [Oscillospiraceae bacterium]|nr:ComEC/Rec2 family competence protein [Oscillospiraceae bacterium]